MKAKIITPSGTPSPTPTFAAELRPPGLVVGVGLRLVMLVVNGSEDMLEVVTSVEAVACVLLSEVVEYVVGDEEEG